MLVGAAVLSKDSVGGGSKELIISSALWLLSRFSFSKFLVSPLIFTLTDGWPNAISSFFRSCSLHRAAHYMAVCFIKSEARKAKEIAIESNMSVTFFVTFFNLRSDIS